MIKIKGIGVDIVNNKRIYESLKNKNFIEKVFSKTEIKKSKKLRNKLGYFSKRFAAKESLSKSIGTGFKMGLNFKDIEVFNDKMGKPYFHLNNKIKKFISKKLNIKNYDLFLSISDEKDYSIAFTIIQNKNAK